AVGRLFTEIHQIEMDIDIDTRLNPIDQAVWYRDQLADNIPAAVDRCYDEIVTGSPTSSSQYCLCHHDLLPENILDTPSGPVVLDWEYASLGEPAFDLAVFIEGCRLNDPSRRALLDSYQGPASLEHIDYYCGLYRLIEVLWWLLKDPGEPDIPGKIERLQQHLA
ncbi:MAG: phosphotransferase, partial [Pseudomonadales bacterium]|nr:phosphotransferase [Pseudomonadales bacterium]